jgi:hypothetical protein
MIPAMSSCCKKFNDTLADLVKAAEYLKLTRARAIILDDPSNVVMLQEIQRNSVMFGSGRRHALDPLGGDIVAHWDNKQRQGVSLFYSTVLSLSIPLVAVVAVDSSCC